MSTRVPLDQRRQREQRRQDTQTRRTDALQRVLRRCWQDGTSPLPLIAGWL